MEKIAIISDIHGNLEALKAVLEDIKSKEIKRIFCLGDIVGKGAHPKECIDLVLENCEIIIVGNLEEYVLSDEKSASGRKDFYKKQLNEEYMDKIKNLAFCHELYISGSLVRLFHASPTSVFDRVNFFEGYESKIKLFYPSDKTISDKNADIVIFGDLHTQFMEKLFNKTLINCGSVGNSICLIRDPNIDSDCKEVTQAFYLIIEGEIDSKVELQSNSCNSSLNFNFARVFYDIEKELQASSNLVEKENYEIELRKGVYRDFEKIKDKHNFN